jgi:alkanesulfonate monooxygenase SsuD/methylene tetrahydromethanopterin reductase-like flavin-dependent oxidoreductase (luciferase family)
VRLHTLVTAVSYRQPGLLAKVVSTLDVLSGGRSGLGISVGVFEAEAQGLGLAFPALSERFEETLGSACKCGAGTTAHLTGATTGSRERSTPRHR